MFYQIKDLPQVDWENGDMYGSPIPDECRFPSELIEPYAKRFMMYCLEELAFFTTPVEDVKKRLKGVEYFISMYGGVHSRLAVSNEYKRFIDTPDDELREIARKIFIE